MYIKLFVDLCSLCPIPFLLRGCKFCVVFVVEIILRAIPVKYGRVSTEITNYIPPPQGRCIVFTEFNVFKYCYLILINLFNINNLLAHSLMVKLFYLTNRWNLTGCSIKTFVFLFSA